MAEHDPVLQASYVRQCLAQEKRPTSFFLGAGCPMSIRVSTVSGNSPLIPDITGMTATVSSELQASAALKAPFQVLLAHFVEDQRSAPNIEQMLGHIRSLRAVAGLGEVRGLTSGELKALDDEICKLISNLADRRLPSPPTPYHSLAAWIGAANRVYPIEIFTTNYDLLMEEALEANRVPYFDGFIGSYQTFFDLHAIESDTLPSRWSRLWKIHGSLNWHQDGLNTVHRSDRGAVRRVIYPSHLKYDESRRMPYLAMLDRVRAFLRQAAAVMIICGYSFNDEHLNELIIQGLQGNPTAVAFAFLHGDIGGYGNAISAARNRANLNLLAKDQAIIGTKQAHWSTNRPSGTCVDNYAVQWTLNSLDPNARDAHFLLGDFAALARFAEDLIGYQHIPQGVPNGH